MPDPITIDAVINAPPDVVWACYTAPDHITGWNFASDDWCCPRAESDLRVGGTYLARMEAKDGSFGFDFVAVHTRVDPAAALSYRIEDGRMVHTTFTPDGSGTRVQTRFDADAEHEAEMQRAGWQAILDNFKRYVEAR